MALGSSFFHFMFLNLVHDSMGSGICKLFDLGPLWQ